MFSKVSILALAALPLVVSGVKDSGVQEETARTLRKKKGKKGKHCKGPFVTYMEWTNRYVLPNGERTAFDGIAGRAYGSVQSYHMDVYDSGDMTNAIGMDVENCNVLDDDAVYYNCKGTYFDMGGCEGNIYFGGSFAPGPGRNVYNIEGGTGDFKNAKGTVTSAYDEASQTSVRTIAFK